MPLVQTKLITKPWGCEYIWAECESYIGKTMVIKPGHRMSLQYHEQKEETVTVIEGVLRIWNSELENQYIDLQVGESFHVNPKQVHRFGCPPLQPCPTKIVEVSTPFLEDVVRIKDDYSRG